MGQTLTHGIYLPDEGERNCYNGLAANWQLLDGAVGTVAEHTTALAGKAPAVHTHTKSDITDFPAYGTTAGTICEGNDSRLSDARTPVAHTHTKSDVTNLLNSNFIPSANNSYDLGSSSYQWNNLYANNYYYNGTAWGLDKVNTWTQNNSFPGITIVNTSWSGVTPPSSTKPTVIEFKNSDTRQGRYINRISSTSSETWIETIRNVDANTSYNHTVIFQVDNSGNKSVYPYSNNDIDLGIGTHQWNNLYAKNYYYNGVAWGLDKANVWSQNQSVVNAVTPKFILQDTRNDRTYSASTTLSGGVMRWECDDKDGAPLSRISTTLRDDKVVQLQFAIFNEDSTGTEFDRTIRFAASNTGSAVYYPEQTGNVDLGDSSHKWKTLNGVNPGALSLPNSPGGTGTVNVNYYDLSGDITVRDGSAPNSYVAPCDGWISIETFATWLQISNDTLIIATTAGIGADGFAQAFLPVRKGNYIRVVVNQTNTQFQSFKLLPCEGNV